jgi:hypothetical protein
MVATARLSIYRRTPQRRIRYAPRVSYILAQAWKETPSEPFPSHMFVLRNGIPKPIACPLLPPVSAQQSTRAAGPSRPPGPSSASLAALDLPLFSRHMAAARLPAHSDPPARAFLRTASFGCGYCGDPPVCEVLKPGQDAHPRGPVASGHRSQSARGVDVAGA